MTRLVLAALLVGLALSPLVAAHVNPDSQESCDEFDRHAEQQGAGQLLHVHHHCNSVNTDPLVLA